MSMRNDYRTAVDGGAVLDYCQNCPIVTTNPTTRRPRRRGVCDCEGHDMRNCQTISVAGREMHQNWYMASTPPILNLPQ